MSGQKHISYFALIREFDFQRKRRERETEPTDVVVLVPFQLFCALNVHVSYFGVLTLWFLLSDELAFFRFLQKM